MPERHVRINRTFWDRSAKEYQTKHGDRLAETARAWGVWRIPEDELEALGPVRGKDVLELGCGAAQWSVALQGLGARAVGIDLSASQLRHAARHVADADAHLPLVQASAEELPFVADAFDLVFCDHGALSFADPRRAIPEAARVLRPRGRLVFSLHSPFLFVAWNPKTERIDRRLHADYFDMHADEDESSIQFQLPYADWIDLFHQQGLEVERLIHLRPPEDAMTTYDDYAPLDWARRWPAEDLWVLTKRRRRRR